MHLLIEEYNTIYEIFLQKIETECYQDSKCNSQKTQETGESIGIQSPKSRWQKNIVVDSVLFSLLYYVLHV